MVRIFSACYNSKNSVRLAVCIVRSLVCSHSTWIIFLCFINNHGAFAFRLQMLRFIQLNVLLSKHWVVTIPFINAQVA